MGTCLTDTHEVYLKSKKVADVNIIHVSRLDVLLLRLVAGDTVYVISVDRFPSVSRFVAFAEAVLNADAELDELGGWGMVEDVPDISFVNENMAIKSTWKTNLGKVVQCEVNVGVTLNVLKGPIGPQVDLAADKYLSGDLSLTQYDLFNGLGPIERIDYIHAISGTEKYLH